MIPLFDAVMQNLDLVITSDTAIAHLAGGLGVPVWVALPHVADWRWLLGRDDSPWYPTMRLFRQTTKGDWPDVFRRMAEELRLLAASRPAAPRPLLVEISAGELVDKISILQIKSERITQPDKRKNVQTELESLTRTRDRRFTSSRELDKLTAGLKEVNEALWTIEEDIRLCEAKQDFGAKFVDLARSVYQRNDARASLKRQVNELLGSRLIEEKSLPDYQAAAVPAVESTSPPKKTRKRKK